MVIIRDKALKYWQQFKIYEKFTEKYLDKGKMEFLKREVELSTNIQLKTDEKENKN